MEAAHRDGVELVRYKMPWLNQRGHFGLPDRASAVVDPLNSIFLSLGGKASEQATKRKTALPGDFIHIETETIIEIDEVQHFTSFRLKSFEYYAPDSPLGFESDEYRDLCRRYAPKADTYRQSKAAPAFGLGGRQRQRAYYDSLRDLAVPAMGLPSLIRVPAPDGNGRTAYERNRERILRAVS